VSKTKLLYGMIDVMETVSEKVIGMLRSQVAKLEHRSILPDPEPMPPIPDPAPPMPRPDPGPTYPEPEPAPLPPLEPDEAPPAI
jgi:hypothetical protein